MLAVQAQQVLLDIVSEERLEETQESVHFASIA